MVRIKVTGWLDTDLLPMAEVDLEHEMGLSTSGYEDWLRRLSMLEDVEFEREAP